MFWMTDKCSYVCTNIGKAYCKRRSGKGLLGLADLISIVVIQLFPNEVSQDAWFAATTILRMKTMCFL